jgi:hypothetical protein
VTDTRRCDPRAHWRMDGYGERRHRHYAHVFAPHLRNALAVLNRTIPGTLTPALHAAPDEPVQLPKQATKQS